MSRVEAPLARAGARRSAWVRRLAEFVSIPSVSADPGRRRDVRRAAGWLLDELSAVGLRRARLIETPGHPVVAAEWGSSSSAPTLLVYGHYDVVPPEPLGGWRTPPFSPVVRDGFLYGRGASDDKGPLLCHLAAIEAWLGAHGRLPVNVRCLFEGEEEIGSPHLPKVVRGSGAWSRVDAAVISDTRMLGPRRPTLIVGLRGNLAAELEVVGPERDLHSGAFGGAVHNPAQVLCELLAGLHDDRGRVTVPGFYRAVHRRTPGDRASPDERYAGTAVLAAAGPATAHGEAGFTAYEQTTARPALDVNGLVSGHTGPGAKSIIPGRALAKLSVRLVPAQDPEEIGGLLRAHLARNAPRTVRVRLTLSKPARPVTIDPGSPALRAAAQALGAGFGARPALLDSGGTIPVVELFAARLGIPTALMGFARPDDGMHAPNERVELAALAAGTRSCIHFLDLLGATGRRTAGGRGAPAVSSRRVGAGILEARA